MAPLRQYLMPSEQAEIALARSAAPPAISDAAEILVLRRNGYAIAVKGSNGFVCMVERGWDASTDDPVFWNPHVRGPDCFNPPAARSVLPIYRMKTRLVLAGKSKAEILAAIESAFAAKQLPALEPGAMSYMLSRGQHLGADGGRWHPHLMFFIAGDAAKSWGANLPGSPVIAANDPDIRATIMMVLARAWSDGTQDLPAKTR